MIYLELLGRIYQKLIQMSCLQHKCRILDHQEIKNSNSGGDLL